eukprot:1097101-Rhodomonas_salina.2
MLSLSLLPPPPRPAAAAATTALTPPPSPPPPPPSPPPSPPPPPPPSPPPPPASTPASARRRSMRARRSAPSFQLRSSHPAWYKRTANSVPHAPRLVQTHRQLSTKRSSLLTTTLRAQYY